MTININEVPTSIPTVSGDDLVAQVEAARDGAEAAAAAAALYDGPWLDTVAALLADTTLTYTAGQPGTVAAGDYVRTRAEGFAYQVAASGASDHHVATAGGVKLYVLPFGDVMPLAAFAPAADGVGDDTAKVQAAATAALAAGVRVHAPAGTYKLTSMVTLSSGLIGAGIGRTIFQAVNDGQKRQEIIRISGAGIYEGFTVDGAVSADPVSWNSSNYDSFTGWIGVYVRTDNVTVRNAAAQNTRQAGFAGWDVENIILENCTTNRSRGNFGDGFFFYYNCRNITHTNCRAYDFTRIGFVFDGDGSNPSEGASYVNCHAEYGHDRSVLYGGAELNSGFWAENCRNVSYHNCMSVDTGRDGFVVAVGSGSTLYQSAGNFSFNACTVERVNPLVASAGLQNGFNLSALGSAYRGNISLTACTVKNVSDQGFIVFGSADAVLTRCSFFKDGGGGQTRAISVETNSAVSVNDFHEEWTNKPAGYLDNSSDAASIGSFSGAGVPPLLVSIDNYRTHDGGYVMIKQRLSASLSGAKIVVKNSHIALGAVFATDGAVFENCKITYAINSEIWVSSGETIFSGCTIALNAHAGVIWRQDVKQVLFQNCKIQRSSGSFRLYAYRVGSAGAANRVWRFTDTVFEANVETGNRIFEQNADPAIFNTPGQDLFFNGCVFVNTGGASASEVVQVQATSLSAAIAYFSGCWKSSTLSTMAKAGGFLATGSVINNL